MDKQPLISFIKDVNKASNNKGECVMTKELAIFLLESKDVYLTSEGKKQLEAIVNDKNGVTLLVSTNS